MNGLLLLFLLVVNFGISWYNAWSVGRFWTESKVIGGWTRFLVWCGVIMSACGFTWVYLTILTIVGVVTEFLTLEQAEVMFALGYLIIIGPILGSGFGIWANSLVRAYRTRKFGDVAVAGYNTFAQGYNTFQAAKHAPGMLDTVLDFFVGGSSGKGKKSRRKSSGDGAAGLLVILLVILAVVGGALTTSVIVTRANKNTVIDVTGGLDLFR